MQYLLTSGTIAVGCLAVMAICIVFTAIVGFAIDLAR